MAFTAPYITIATAGALILLQIMLMLGVVTARRANKQSLGDGNNSEVLRAVRRHGNLAENAALFIVGFALLEMSGSGAGMVAALCLAFLVARICHAIGLSMEKTVNPLRVVGAVGTALVGVALGVRLLMIGLPHLM